MVFHGADLTAPAIREAKVRVKSALVNSGFKYPSGTVNVCLDTEDGYPCRSVPDLPMAIGILFVTGQLALQEGVAVVGHLGLDGALLPTDGVVSKALQAHADGVRTLYLPSACAVEASLVPGLEVVPVHDLAELVAIVSGRIPKPVVPTHSDQPASSNPPVDLAEIRGQEHAKRALEIAAAGGHSILLVGPAGAGKTMLARRLATLLPPMTELEALEVATIHSGAGMYGQHAGLPTLRPFRAPHHTVSDIAMTGGGQLPRPGETALAHHGVLYLDDLPEFRRDVLDLVAHIHVARESVVRTQRFGVVTFPADFQLVGSMMPCLCGHLGDPRRACTCTTSQIEKYRARVIPFIESMFDLVVEVSQVAVETLRGSTTGETSSAVQARVMAARSRHVGRLPNAQIEAKDLPTIAPLAASETAFIEKVVDRLGLSAEQYHRIVRVARTVADLDGSVHVRVEHVAEAVQYGGRVPW